MAVNAMSNRRFQLLQESGGHRLVIVGVPDNRTIVNRTLPDFVLEKVLCVTCGMLKDTVLKMRQCECGDSITSNKKKRLGRLKMVTKLQADLDEAIEAGRPETVTARYQGSLRYLRATLELPPKTAERVDHDMVDILVVDGKRPRATAVCRACRTIADDPSHGRRMTGMKCHRGIQRNGSERKRCALIAGITKAAEAETAANTRREYYRTLELLQPTRDAELVGLAHGIGPMIAAAGGGDPAEESTAVPTTPSRRWGRRGEGSSAASSAGAWSPLPA